MAAPRPVFLSALGLVNALGRGKGEVARRLFLGESSNLELESGWLPSGPALVGRVPGPLPEPPAALAGADSRTSRLLLAALEEIRDLLRDLSADHG